MKRVEGAAGPSYLTSFGPTFTNRIRSPPSPHRSSDIARYLRAPDDPRVQQRPIGGETERAARFNFAVERRKIAKTPRYNNISQIVIVSVTVMQYARSNPHSRFVISCLANFPGEGDFPEYVSRP